MPAIRKTSRENNSRKASAAARKAEWERLAPQRERDRDEAYRILNTRFLFWTVCASKACQRAKSCAGNVDGCFKRWWPEVPDELKIFFRAGIKARCAGHSVAEAARMADAEVERCKALDARWAARTSSLAPRSGERVSSERTRG